jgi:hypothetical protein
VHEKLEQSLVCAELLLAPMVPLQMVPQPHSNDTGMRSHSSLQQTRSELMNGADTLVDRQRLEHVHTAIAICILLPKTKTKKIIEIDHIVLDAVDVH